MSQTASTVSSSQPDQAALGVDHDPARADELRAAMVRELRDKGVIVSDQVAAAFAAVPRHVFAPGETLEAAYAAHGTVMPKRDADGLLLSVLSAPNIQAMMLEPAGVKPGMRILEIGSGGVNAALIAELARPGGRVTTMDIDPEVTSRTRVLLEQTGNASRVTVVTGDAACEVVGAPVYRQASRRRYARRAPKTSSRPPSPECSTPARPSTNYTNLSWHPAALASMAPDGPCNLTLQIVSHRIL